MGLELARAYVTVGADSRALPRDLESAKSTVMSSLGGLGSTIKGLFASIIGGLGIHAMLSFAERATHAAEEEIHAMERLEAVLEASGHAAGFSAAQLEEHTKSLEAATTTADDTIRSVQTNLLRFHAVSGDVFKRATELAVDLGETGFASAQSAAFTLGRALESPMRGMMNLRRMGVMLTEQQQAQIKQFVQTGQTLKAQAVILDAVNAQVGGVAKRMAQSDVGQIKQLRNAIENVREEIGARMIPISLMWQRVKLNSIRIIDSVVGSLTEFVRMIGAFNQYTGGSVVKLAKVAVGLTVMVSTIWLINKALVAYRAYQQGATAATVLFQAIAGGPAGWAAIAAGILAGLVAIKAVNVAFEGVAATANAAAAKADHLGKSVDGVGDASASVSRLNDIIDATRRGIKAADTATNEYQQSIQKMKHTLDDTVRTLRGLENALKGQTGAMSESGSSDMDFGGLENAADALDAISAASGDASSSMGNAKASVADLSAQLEQQRIIYARLADAPGQLGASARATVAAMDRAREAVMAYTYSLDTMSKVEYKPLVEKRAKEAAEILGAAWRTELENVNAFIARVHIAADEIGGLPVAFRALNETLAATTVGYTRVADSASLYLREVSAVSTGVLTKPSQEIVTNAIEAASKLTALRDDLALIAARPGLLGENAKSAIAGIDAMNEAIVRLRAVQSGNIDEMRRYGVENLSVADAARALVAVVQAQSEWFGVLSEKAGNAVGALGGVENAMAEAARALESIKSPQTLFQDQKRQIEALAQLFPTMFGPDVVGELMTRAGEDLDQALGGPKEKLRDMALSAESMRAGFAATTFEEAGRLTQRMQELQQFMRGGGRGKEPGADDVETFKRMQEQLESLQQQTTVADAIRDARHEMESLTVEVSGASVALDEFMRLPGVTTIDISEFAALQEQLKHLKKEMQLKEEGKELIKAMRTPAEEGIAQFQKLKDMLAGGFIDETTYNRAIEDEMTKLQQPAFSGSLGFQDLGRQIQDSLLRNNDPNKTTADESIKQTKLLQELKAGLIDKPKPPLVLT